MHAFRLLTLILTSEMSDWALSNRNNSSRTL